MWEISPTFDVEHGSVLLSLVNAHRVYLSRLASLYRAW